ncbi:MAG: hypothetical protein IKU15_00140 [Clostridia bacterium]|nr:hypothetical protein [Clostridia bacterium]
MKKLIKQTKQIQLETSRILLTSVIRQLNHVRNDLAELNTLNHIEFELDFLDTIKRDLNTMIFNMEYLRKIAHIKEEPQMNNNLCTTNKMERIIYYLAAYLMTNDAVLEQESKDELADLITYCDMLLTNGY